MAIKDLTILKSLVSKIMAMKGDSEWEDAINEVLREYIWERDGILTEEEEEYIKGLGYWSFDMEYAIA